jgi:hypothetical protein
MTFAFKNAREQTDFYCRDCGCGHDVTKSESPE